MNIQSGTEVVRGVQGELGTADSDCPRGPQGLEHEGLEQQEPKLHRNIEMYNSWKKNLLGCYLSDC